MRARLRPWTPLVLHWRRRPALCPAARPAPGARHFIYNVYNLTGLRTWQLATRAIERSLRQSTTLHATLREKQTLRLFAQRERVLHLSAVERVLLKSHTMAGMRERHVLRETQTRLERSIVRSFRLASFATERSETRSERRLFHALRASFFMETRREREARLERTQLPGLHMSSRTRELRHETHRLTATERRDRSGALREIRREATRRLTAVELRHRSEVLRERATASGAPSLVWRKREPASAPPVPAETVEIRKHGAATHAAQTLSAPAAARAARAAAAPFDRATMDRLAEDVIARIERRMRLERERRGL
ncbi:MAG TPA: hypothetical protein VG889_05705 [Rhizomicrobium sp.]|nr:hypothetical protein [Rhizomicrobium sp.]